LLAVLAAHILLLGWSVFGSSPRQAGDMDVQEHGVMVLRIYRPQAPAASLPEVSDKRRPHRNAAGSTTTSIQPAQPPAEPAGSAASDEKRPPAVADASPAGAASPAPRLDLDALKTAAASAVLAETTTHNARLSNHRDETAATAIRQATRPNCDNEYAARIGNVQFNGLMKLPFLVRGAVGEKGCKW
jgi:hypothetical protein